jgi:hypothetical protein
MATELEVRQAIVEHILTVLAAFDPAPLVMGRDVADSLETDSVNDLRDEAGRIHVWTVTPNGAIPVDPGMGAVEYDLLYDVIQWIQFWSGNESANSDIQASMERDAVLDGFKDSSVLPGVLNGARPVEFPRGSIGISLPALRGRVKQSKGLLRISNAYGCS